MKKGLVIKSILIGLVVPVVIGVSSIGCKEKLSSITEQRPLIPQLSVLKGVFSFRKDLNDYDHSAKVELESILSKLDSNVVVTELANCIDDQDLSQSLFEGRNVPVGIVCYEALTQTIYHEPMDSKGDVAKEWPGIISPKATPEEMSRAESAWKKVIASKKYSVL